MKKLEKELTNKLNDIDKIMDKQVIKCKEYLECEDNKWICFKIDTINIENFSKYKNKGGIYYLQIKFNGKLNKFNNKEKIFDLLVKEWKSDNRNKIPNIIKKRRHKYDKEYLKGDNWIPFYIGKSNNFGNRINEHFNKEISSETYSLKLNCITSDFFKDCDYRIKFIEMTQLVEDKYYWSVVNIESKLREKLHPICGKQ